MILRIVMSSPKETLSFHHGTLRPLSQGWRSRKELARSVPNCSGIATKRTKTRSLGLTIWPVAMSEPASD